MRIASVGHGFPPHYYSQEQLVDALERHWLEQHFNPQRLQRLHRNVLVSGRHLALTLEEYEQLESWGEANDAWIRVAQEVGAVAIREAIDKASLALTDIDALITVTVTGVATPSLDARLMNRLALRPDVKRTPIFGLGCVAGAAGIARASDYLRAYPEQTVVLLSVELCSLTVQRQDLSIPNLIATGLFGDGAAAVVLRGADTEPETTGPEIIDTRSVFYPNTERVMGWDISDQGFGIVLSAEVPQMVERHLRHDVDTFLADHGLSRQSIESWVCHPGGPKVLLAMQEALEVEREALAVTWDSLERVGNLSSTSVLLVLEETMEQHRPAAGSYGVLLSMGPGFCCEMVLLRW